MDLHPLFVHFPIALLIIYSLIEIVSWKKIKENVTWFYIKFSFLALGVFLALITLETGNAAKDNLKDISLMHLVSVHSWWATATTALFGIILIIYLIELFSNDKLIQRKIMPRFAKKTLKKISDLIFRPVFLKILAVIGAIMITVTGSLGGAIVYGPNADPLVKVIYHFLIGE